ncbi:MAG: DJ-1/PfpI family protein [Pseudarcicella sp.]|nr:DJ-1/PfpI family protein [Pseudarcicella sp.]MBP6410803.1 DJ-1/PfpI family protein [Pseudarcicella sp.]
MDKNRISRKIKISVCTGSLILGAAGFLKDKTATTHFKNYPLWEPYCKNVSKENIVDDHQIITAGAVANSINLGLYLCQLWAGKMAHDDIKKQMDL